MVEIGFFDKIHDCCCQQCKFGEKITSIPKILNFSYGLLFGEPCMLLFRVLLTSYVIRCIDIPLTHEIVFVFQTF